MATIYIIPVCNIPALTAGIEAMNRKAVKLGLPAVTMLLGAITPGKPATDGTPGQDHQAVEIDGVAPVLEGWNLVATIVPQDNGENLVKEIPGEACPVEYRAAKMACCDHCNSVRARKMLVVVRNAVTGEFKRLGRQCVADFLGRVTPQEIAERLQWLETLDNATGEGWGGSAGYKLTVTTEEYLTAVCGCIETYGWVGKSQAGFDRAPTASRTWDFWRASYKAGGETVIPAAELKAFMRTEGVRDAMKAKAVAVLEWAKALTGANGYEYNLGVAARQENVTPKDCGIIASAVVAHFKAMESEAARLQRETNNAARLAADAVRPESQHVGIVGQRTDFNGLKVVMIRKTEGAYGVTSVVKFNDEAGNVVVWFATGVPDIDEGDTVSIKATVKAHDEFRGVRQTVVTRSKVTALTPATNAA
jgi:hypothetical protein